MLVDNNLTPGHIFQVAFGSVREFLCLCILKMYSAFSVLFNQQISIEHPICEVCTRQ